MEEVNEPVVSELEHRQELDFHGHKIELITQKDGVSFTDIHIEKINYALEFYWSIDPELVKKYTEIISSSSNPNAKWASGHLICGRNANALNESNHSAIILTQNGMSLTVPHRISSSNDPNSPDFVDACSGTLIHELAHGGQQNGTLYSDWQDNRLFIKTWQKKFGWKFVIFELDEQSGKYSPPKNSGWNRNEQGFYQNGDYIVYNKGDIAYTTMPERCIGGIRGYAATSGYNCGEDICDSMTTYVLNPKILDPEKKLFLEENIEKSRKFADQRKI